MEKGVVWVIGASSGLGLATAAAFAEKGWRVIAGARSFTAEAPASTDGIQRLPLDVTDATSVEAFTGRALSLSPHVDALVYCAGLLVLGSCEETATGEYQRVMETNFIGMTRMVSAALPTMRTQGKGRIILFSSINGLLGIPFQSAYTASKHAIEGYAECLRMETKPYGITVSLVEPGDHRSGSQAYRLRAEREHTDSPYAAEYASACAIIHRDESGGLGPQKLGRKVERLASGSRRFRRRVAKPDQRLAVAIHRLLPASVGFGILRSYYIKKGR